MRAEMGCDEGVDVPEHLRFVYDLGGYITMRCPLLMSGTPFVQTALDLYGDYKRGHLPNARGIRHETAAYRNTMRALCSLESESEAWVIKQKSPKKGGN